MTKKTAKQLIIRSGKAHSIKSSWDTEYRKVTEYCTPARDGYQKDIDGEGNTDPQFQDRRENLYSSIGEQAANEFVNTMQEVVAPPLAPWIAIKAGFKVPEGEREKKDEELSKLCDIMNEYKNNSSFDMAFAEFCYDVFIGTGCLLVLPGTPDNPLIFKAIPLWEYSLEEGPDGLVIAVYRKYKMKREFLATQWKELKNKKYTEDQLDKEIEILESTFYDPDLKVWHYQVIDVASGDELVHRQYRTNPFIVLRWNKCAGEPYGRGVGMTAINDIKTLNLIKYYSLRNLAFNTPPIIAQEDAALDVDEFDFTPMTINIVPDIEGIKALQMPTNYDIESYKTQELEMQIKKDTLGSTLPSTGGREVTATEVREIKLELQRRLNSVFGRLLYEFQIPLVKRILDVLSDTGVLGPEHKKKFDVLNVNGLHYKVDVITPLGKILKHGEAQSMLAAASTLLQFDPTGQKLDQSVEIDEMLAYYLELVGMPVKFIKSPEESKATQNKQAQAQQDAEQNAIDADVVASNQKEVGKVAAQNV